MNTIEVQALESYFKTENEHWSGYALKSASRTSSRPTPGGRDPPHHPPNPPKNKHIHFNIFHLQ